MTGEAAADNLASMAAEATAERPQITPSMLVMDVLAARAGAAALLAERGLPCSRCVVAEADALETCLRAYGLDVGDIVRALDALP